MATRRAEKDSAAPAAEPLAGLASATGVLPSLDERAGEERALDAAGPVPGAYNSASKIVAEVDPSAGATGSAASPFPCAVATRNQVGPIFGAETRRPPEPTARGPG